MTASSDALIAANTPTDHEVIEGILDHMTCKVDVATKEVVTYQPTPPSSDHEWDVVLRRWQLKEAAQMRVNSQRRVLLQLEELDKAQLRPLLEHALGDAAATLRLKDIADRKAALRKQL